MKVVVVVDNRRLDSIRNKLLIAILVTLAVKLLLTWLGVP